MRLEFHTGLVGSILPGDSVRSGPPWLLTTCVPVVDRLVDAGPPVDERHACGVVEEHDPDVPAGLAAVLVVDGVYLTRVVVRAARRDDRIGELADRLVGGDDAVVGRAVVVLHLLDRDDVGLGEIGHQVGREPLELRVGIARSQVLDVVGRHRELLVCL